LLLGIAVRLFVFALWGLTLQLAASSFAELWTPLELPVRSASPSSKRGSLR
jgi:hypothetical protein